MRRHFAACFILPDGRIYQVEAGEIFIGTGKNADLKLGIPGADRGEYRGCLWGIKPLHVQVCAREDGWFYIRNLTDTPVLTKIGQTEEVLLEGDSERKLLHGMNINFGTYQITFYRGCTTNEEDETDRVGGIYPYRAVPGREPCRDPGRDRRRAFLCQMDGGGRSFILFPEKVSGGRASSCRPGRDTPGGDGGRPLGPYI